jgi:hypothetical protein
MVNTMTRRLIVEVAHWAGWERAQGRDRQWSTAGRIQVRDWGSREGNWSPAAGVVRNHRLRRMRAGGRCLRSRAML